METKEKTKQQKVENLSGPALGPNRKTTQRSINDSKMYYTKDNEAKTEQEQTRK